MTDTTRGREPNHAPRDRLDRGPVTDRVDFSGQVAAKKEHTSTIHKLTSVADEHAQLTVAGTTGAVGQCTHTVPARVDEGIRRWSDRGHAQVHPRSTEGVTAMEKIQRKIHTGAVFSEIAQLTATGRLGTVGPIQTHVQFLVAKERERGLEHARAITHHRDMAGKRVGERAQKVIVSNAVNDPVLGTECGPHGVNGSRMVSAP